MDKAETDHQASCLPSAGYAAASAVCWLVSNSREQQRAREHTAQLKSRWALLMQEAAVHWKLKRLSPVVTASIYGVTIRIESALGGLLLLALISYVLVYSEWKLSALEEWKHSVTVLCQLKAGLHQWMPICCRRSWHLNQFTNKCVWYCSVGKPALIQASSFCPASLVVIGAVTLIMAAVPS